MKKLTVNEKANSILKREKRKEEKEIFAVVLRWKITHDIEFEVVQVAQYNPVVQ